MQQNRNRNNSELPGNDFLVLQPQDASAIRCFKQVIPLTIYHYYISDPIEDHAPFYDLLNTLKTAEAHDRIIIYLNCPGGALYVAIQIVNAIQTSQATVITCLDGQVCSAATLIFLVGHEYIVNKHGSFMIHNYSEGVVGKGNEIISRVKHATDWFEKLTYDIYGNFLTAKEIEDILQGKDLWLDSDAVLERLQKNEQKEDAEEQAEEEVEEIVPIKVKRLAKPKPPAKKIDKKK
jgi:ATP-dependent protease ClpP protease subunit